MSGGAAGQHNSLVLSRDERAGGGGARERKEGGLTCSKHNVCHWAINKPGVGCLRACACVCVSVCIRACVCMCVRVCKCLASWALAARCTSDTCRGPGAQPLAHTRGCRVMQGKAGRLETGRLRASAYGL